VQAVFAERAFLRDCLLRAGELEADAALARHLLESPQWCWAQPGEHNKLRIDDAVHPLVPSPAPLSIALHGKGAFISGQNGVGKSTFMRTLGLNLATARGFGFCYAASAHVPMQPVYASMQNEDSLSGGESLYMAELRRARELLDSAGGPHAGIYLVDEIFRGTNHLESVAAGAAVLDTLAERGLVLVSSHNVELASLLAHRLQPYCMARPDREAGLQLRPGVLADTNGIALLAKQGFAPEVQQKAARVARWLERYLAEPDVGKTVLGEDASA
jgi:DNA mismatch repair ATPase MutS